MRVAVCSRAPPPPAFSDISLSIARPRLAATDADPAALALSLISSSSAHFPPFFLPSSPPQLPCPPSASAALAENIAQEPGLVAASGRSPPAVSPSTNLLDAPLGTALAVRPYYSSIALCQSQS
ncbi:hypothetical protein BV20DRAFT_966710 [Pilatotrama ljubarskyi]|nr:hypothetical protein BV20DRAFT_966710 [Pilatotrama ljubarskyi]